MAYNVSEAFREQCYSGESLYSCRLIIGGNTIPISQIASITISSPIVDSDSETFYIGTFISQKLTIKFKNLDGIETASGTNVELYISQNVSGTDVEVPIGKYLIDESPENYYQSATIECLDYAIKFATNLDYSSALVDEKIKIDDLLQWICTHYGITLGSYPDTNGDVEIGTYDSTVSGKRWISYIAEIKGCNAKMDREGQLTLVPLKSSPVVTIDALKSKSWELGEKYEISGVTFFDAIRNYSYGDDTKNTLIIRQDNPFIVNKEVVKNIFEEVSLNSSSVEQNNNFKIDNTVNGIPIEDFKMYGDTQQDSTTGKNKAKITDTNISSTNYSLKIANNIINVTTTSSANSFDLCNGTRTGQYTPSYTNANDYNLTIANQETYKISLIDLDRNISGTANQILSVFTNQRAIEIYIPPSASIYGTTSFTLQENEYIKSIYLWTNNSTSITKLQFKLQLELGSTATDYEPYTNGASPNPDYPQPIHNVSGDNTIEICGKNLFDITQYPILQKVAYNGSGTKVTWASYVGIEEYIPITSNTAYTITSSLNVNLDRVVYYDSSKNILSNTANVSTFTTPNNAKYIRFCYYTPSETIPTWVMLNKGSTALPYEAYTGQSQLISLGVENLFDKDNANVYNGYFTPSSPTITSNSNHRTIYIPIQPNTTYTIQKSNVGGDKARFGIGTTTTIPTTNVSVNQVALNNTYLSQTITTNASAKYLVVWCYFTDNTSITESELLATIQIEKGSKANSYSEYGANYIELNKISTYQDYIYKDNGKWYLHKEIGKKVLNGSENWNSSTANYYTIIDNIMLGSSGYSNYFVNSTTLGTFGYFRVPSTQHWLIFMAVSSQYTSQEWKTWLSTHNTIVYYVLSTPTDTEITNEELLGQLNNIKENAQFYSGTTNISSTAPITFKSLTYAPFICYSIKNENYGDISLDAWDNITYTLGNDSYNTLNNNTITYEMTIMSKVDTKIPTKQQEITTNVVEGTEEQRLRTLKTEVNGIEGTITLQAEQISENTANISSLQIAEAEISAEVSNTQTIVNNNYQEITSKFNDYALQNDYVTLENSVRQIQSDTYTKTEINTKLTDGSVTKVMTTSGTFDENGMHYEKTNAPTKTTINEKGVEVDSSSSDSELLFAGYDENTNQTIVRTDNMTVRRYCVIGDNSRLEDYGNGGGIFIL